MSRKRRTRTAKRPATDKKPAKRKRVIRTISPRCRWLLFVVFLLLLCGGVVFADWWICLPEDIHAEYVGSEACIDCHQEYYDEWKGSHHDLAMDRATPDTVLGDFDNAEIEHFEIKSRLFRQDGKYMVHTEGPDGNMADFEVKYVFGVTPLQQYMVEFDRPADMPDDEIARLQVLRISWDTERKKWFYLRPPDVDEKLAPDDDLHWTGIAQRWNNMCADCHSTDLQKNFDDKAEVYHTTFSEIDVGCEACHGPGSLHVELAESNSLFWDRKLGFGLPSLKEDAQTQIHTCAPCHSRRRVVSPDFRPGEDFYDHYGNELLQQETYHADGQILDEVYVYSSFIQSKMYHKGIRCTDCHNPHTARLKYNDNAVCTTCHQHPAGKYDGPAHHHHDPDSTGAACAECHMPQTTYMAVDPRRDHSLRIPQPELSVELSTPNACTRCHLQKEIDEGKLPEFAERDDLKQYLDWILAARDGDQQVKQVLERIDAEMKKACDEWYEGQPRGPRQRRHFAFALDAARRGEPDGDEELTDLVSDGRLPAIVRATAMFELGRYDNEASTRTTVKYLEDPDPQIRAAAVAGLQGRLHEEELAKTLAPLLSDPVRSVRTDAARVLAGVSDRGRRAMRGAQRDQLKVVLAEYERGQMLNNDVAGGHLNLALLYENLGDSDRAIGSYEAAIRVQPTATGPRTNLAELYNRLADATEFRSPQRASEYREKAATLRQAALKLAARDARLLPNNAAIQYRYGLSLYLHRQMEEAETALTAAHKLEPNNAQFLHMLVLFHQKLKQFDKAIPLAEKLARLRPDASQLLEAIRQEKEAAGQPGPTKQ